MLTTRDEQIGGRRVRVARAGTGPPLVLLHGYPDDLQVWTALHPLLAARFEVVALDWPGMGRSEPWPGGTTPWHAARRLAVILDALGLGPATLVGLDMGGQPALALAALEPARVARLVVMNSLVFGDAPTSWEIRVLRRFGWNRLLLERLPRLVFRRALATFLTGERPLPSELSEEMWSSFRPPAVRRFIARTCAGYQGTLARLPELYPRITCPTLVLWGGADGHFPPLHGERLHAAIPGSRLAVLPGAGHWMVWERAEEVAERILRFA